MQARVVLLAALALMVAGATPARAFPHHRRQEAAPEARRSPEKTFPLGTIWVLQSIDGKPVTGDAPSFKIDSALRASGFAGCNTFSMTLYPVKDQKLAAGGIALTRNVCDAGTMAREHTMLLALHSLPKWDLAVDGTLSVRNGATLLVFRNGI